jgi:hypothetical protein
MGSPWLHSTQDSPASSLRKTPPAEIPTHNLSAFTGSTAIECKHKPPKPDPQRGRIGCCVSPIISVHVSPSSRLAKSAVSSTPAYHVPGCDGCPGTICQMRFSFAVDSAANFGSHATSHRVTPRSSEMRMAGPDPHYSVPTSIRPPRASPQTLNTSQPPRYGPDNVHFFRHSFPE